MYQPIWPLEKKQHVNGTAVQKSAMPWDPWDDGMMSSEDAELAERLIRKANSYRRGRSAGRKHD